MKKTNEKIELPLMKPLYSTYHHQGVATAILASNPSIRNWYLNEATILTCLPNFLKGYTSPEITVMHSSWNAIPYFDKKHYDMKYLGGYVHFVIQKLLDDGYYVYFQGPDDYYVEGKSWYHAHHFFHDGCICGYDRENKTYCIYAYDQNWIYQKFRTPQKAFDAGRIAGIENGKRNYIYGIKPQDVQLDFSPETALKRIAEHLDSDMTKYPEASEKRIYGTVVHDYIVKYLDMLFNGSIPYEKIDRRVFRLIWEHKTVMLERIERIESELQLDHTVSRAYRAVVREANTCRMLYASHQLKQRNSLLPMIQKKLLALKAEEETLLKELLTKGTTKP